LQARLAEAERALAAQRRSEQQRVEAAMQVREREITTLYHLSEIALREPQISVTLDAAAQVVSADTGFPIVAIEYYNESQQQMELVAAAGIPAHSIPMHVPVAQTLSGVVAQSGQPVIETQALDRPEYAYAPLRELGVQTFVCVPMILHARVIGTLALAHPEPISLTTRLVPWARSLANVLALMVDRARAEEQIAASAQQSRAILDKLATGVVVVDADGRYTFANARAALMFGLTPAEVVGRTHFDVLPPEVAQTYLERNRRFIATNAAEEYEATFTLPVGERTFFIADQVLTDAQGTGYALLSSSIDITARVRAEAALRDLLHEKEVLLKEIHHRVKNNLQVVMSLLRLQSRQVTDAQAVAALRDSRQRVEVMALVHELLYRTEDMAAINAALYFQQLGTQLTQIYAATPNQITLSVVAEGIGLSLNQAVPCGLIVSELIANSLKYAFPDGQPGAIGVDLRATSPDRLTLTVWDTGVGIAPNADGTSPQSLGMTLVHDLVRQLRGSVVIANGVGVIVTITFPQGAASAQAADAH
jgi:PAS domain S-box-containing protein